MDAEFEKVLAEFHERSERERKEFDAISRKELWARVDEFLLPVGEDVGRLMNMLVKTSGARVLVEVGTSHGYSAMWLGDAARATGGRLYSYDLHADKQAYAREALGRAGVADRVELVNGNAHEKLKELAEPVEFALIDHWKTFYLECYEVLLPKLAPGAIVVADNVTFPEDTEGHVQAYRDAVAATPGMTTFMLPIGNGIELSRYNP